MGRQAGYRPDDSIRDRFFRLVDRSNGCWIWRGNYSTYGYGRIQFNKKRYAAHRVSFELHHSPLREGTFVCHRCDNPACVNPDHLFEGDQFANMADCVAKGRFVAGEKSPHAKLSAAQIVEIRSLHATGKYTHDALADIFGCGRPNITKIINRYRWKG